MGYICVLGMAAELLSVLSRDSRVGA
jgi:hypothetical protein